MDKKSKTIVDFNEVQEKMIQDLKDHFGHYTKSEAIRSAIAYYYSNTIGKDYVQIQKKRLEYLSANVRTGKSKKEEAIENGLRICDQLKGEVVTDDRGNQICKYQAYTKMAGGEYEESDMMVSVEDLSDINIKNQYHE